MDEGIIPLLEKFSGFLRFIEHWGKMQQINSLIGKLRRANIHSVDEIKIVQNEELLEKETIYVTDPLTKIQRKFEVPWRKNKDSNKIKSGMYDELPVITIGKYTIAEMTNGENQDTVWIKDTEENIGGEFSKELLYQFLDEYFNKYI